MILAVDPGLATCGWAVVEPGTGRVLDLGAILSKPDANLTKQADRIVRLRHQADTLELVIAEHNCGAIAAEALSFNPFGQGQMIASLCLSWGMLVGLSSSWSIPIVDVSPKQWQHAVLGERAAQVVIHTNAKGKHRAVKRKPKVEYSEVFDALHVYVEGMSISVVQKLLAITKGQRNHPLDAVGVGVYASLNRGG